MSNLEKAARLALKRLETAQVYESGQVSWIEGRDIAEACDFKGAK